MDSSRNSNDSLSKLQITFSEDDPEYNNKSIGIENSILINYSQSKDYSLQNNFINLEKDLSLLSKEVHDLRKKNRYLTESLNSLHQEKESLIISHKQELEKTIRENRKNIDSLESEKRSLQKQCEKLKIELTASQKSLKKCTVSAEHKVKELQKEIGEKKESFKRELEKKDKEINDLIKRIRNIENNACQFKATSTRAVNHYHSANNLMKKTSSALLGNKSIYSIDQLSEIIVNLEKNQADLKERIMTESHSEQRSLNYEASVNEIKLSEARELQKKILKSRQSYN